MILQEMPPVYPPPPVYPHHYLLAPDVGAGQHQSRGLVMATGAAEVELAFGEHYENRQESIFKLFEELMDGSVYWPR